MIGLIGERGRELHDFLEHSSGPRAARAAVVVRHLRHAGDAAPARRLPDAAVAEALRDQGLNVLCLIDSVTRFAMALREIYLAAGEAPATRGYPPACSPSCRGCWSAPGPATGEGSITGLFTRAGRGRRPTSRSRDAVRGILDGHVVLDRRIAEAGRFPAVDVLRSLSRTAPGCYVPTSGRGRARPPADARCMPRWPS